MEFVFDHLVHFVEEPEKAVQEFQAVGFHAVEGGVHEDRGTYNGLSYFGLSYIEFLGTYDRDLVKNTEHPSFSLISTIIRDEFREGFARFAIRTTNIEGVAQRFKEHGLKMTGPVPLHRKRPDGSVVKWQLLYAGTDEEGPELPFIIQWEAEDDEREKDLIQQKVMADHPNGEALKIASLSFAVKDLKESVRQWSILLNAPVKDAYTDEKLNAQGQAVVIGDVEIIFYEPIGKGIVQHKLESRGEKPFQIVIQGGKEEKSFDLFHGHYIIKQ